MLPKYKIILKKISSTIKKLDNKRLSFLLENYDNIAIFPNGNYIDVELWLENSKIDDIFLRKIKKEFLSYEITDVLEKNWILKNVEDDKEIESDFFSISQGLTEPKKKKNLILLYLHLRLLEQGLMSRHFWL